MNLKINHILKLFAYYFIVYGLSFIFCSYFFIKNYNEQKRLEEKGVVVTPDKIIIEEVFGEDKLKISYSVDGKTFYQISKRCSNEKSCFEQSKSLKLIVNPHNPNEFKEYEHFENFHVAWLIFFWSLVYFLFIEGLKRAYPKKL